MAANDLFTLTDLKLQVGLNLGATDDVSLAKCGKYINRALIRFSEMGFWSWQYVYEQAFPGATSVTVAGIRTYDVPNCIKITSLYQSGSNQRKLKLLDDRKYRARFPNDSFEGAPEYYLHRGRSATSGNKDIQKIGLYPIPDAAYTLKWDGIRPISLLVNETDDVRIVTGMPVTMLDILIEMATAIGWKEIDDSDAQTQMQEVLTRLQGAYADDNHDIEDRLIMSEFAEGQDWRDPVLPTEYGRD